MTPLTRRQRDQHEYHREKPTGLLEYLSHRWRVTEGSYQRTLPLDFTLALYPRTPEANASAGLSLAASAGYPARTSASPAYLETTAICAALSFSRQPPTEPVRTKRASSRSTLCLRNKVPLPSVAPDFLAFSSFSRIARSELFSTASRTRSRSAGMPKNSSNSKSPVSVSLRRSS